MAFSGGVDSTLLLAAAKEVLGDSVIGVTAVSSIVSRKEKDNAAFLANRLGVKQILCYPAVMDNDEFLKNTNDRCRVCKQIIFSEIKRISEENGIRDIAHGVNTDDFNDYRPGIRAAEEMGIHAPLVEAGLDKETIRSLAKEMGLPNWDRPAMACLASRIPFNVPVHSSLLQMIEQSEAVLGSCGFHSCRVRYHGEIARIEIDQEDFDKIMDKKTRDYIVGELKSLGFTYVAIDLQGYVQGSLNVSAVPPPG